MVDTIKIQSDAFGVRPDNDLTVKPAPFKAATGLGLGDYPLWEGVHGRGAYYDAGRWQLDIKPLGGKVRALVHLSVPRMVDGDLNVEPATKQEAVETFGRLEQELSEVGVMLDLKQANLSRLDLFKNVHTDFPFREYVPLFRALDVQRTKDTRQYGMGTYQYGNSKQQVALYDKVEETRDKLHVQLNARNLARCELRMFGGEKIGKTTGLFRVRDLLDGWNEQNETYSNYMEQTLFRHKPADVSMLAVRNLERAVEFAKAKYGRYWVRRMLGAFGVQKLLEYGDMGTVVDVISGHMSVRGQRKARRTVRQLLKQSRFDLEMLQDRHKVGFVPLAEMYFELRGKVLNKAA